MAKYRKISPTIWNDTKFRTLNERAKLVFFMLLTHPQTSSIGSLRAFPQGLAPEMGWSEKEFRKPFEELLAKGMVKCAETDGLIWLPNFIKHNMPENPNVFKSWAGALDTCPECPLKSEIFQYIKELVKGLGEGFRKVFEQSFSEPLPKSGTLTGAGTGAGEESGDEAAGTLPPLECEPPDCPQKKIQALYHEYLPELPRVKVWEGAREDNLRARWRERWDSGKYTNTAEGLEYWGRLFKHIHDKCPWLTGKITGRDNRPFFASLSWIVCPENFAKIIEGRYDRKDGAA